ncbi:acyl-CoA dehydrogenase [Ponticoccus sp. (in: a-proteobacteria)]|uniref:acyl-CoA dehydrogenase n=1 Tax=Ponticoccus sp. (in: a-proteobacteria) TaxID=1925025 RepID=UPI003AB3A506
MPYRAPLEDFRRILTDVVGYEQVSGTDLYAEAGMETVEAVLTEAGKMCEEVLAPLNRNGDLDPARLENGRMRTPRGFAEGYKAIAEGGWVAISAAPESGGMGLPMAVTTCVNDMMGSACLALQLNPLMTQGQIEALEHHASDELKALYLPKLVTGEWQGTMNLTEPQAGSDVGALSTRAEPLEDGTYAITGQKIYITWGDNDFTENVCHLVLARLPDAVPGTKGISLFLVPRNIPDADGNPGVANDLKVVSLEHKLGMHGSPTCVMQYDGARGWLVGKEGGGMRAMFTMMNNARLGVGVQGVAIAEAATQAALAYAQERRQGRTPEGTIIGHADVRRMLATMRADTFAARAIALAQAVAIDMGRATGEADWQARAALLTPITKAFGTDTGIAVADMGVQVHGGMGYIEETGAAQFLRDVRVTAIYEGTNGIQAMDLVGRKMMDGGEAAYRLLDEIEGFAETARGQMPELATRVWEAAESLRETTEALVATEVADRFAGAVPYLRGFARVLGGYFHLRAAMAQPEGGAARLARFYIERLLPEHTGLLVQARAGSDAVMQITADDLAA